MRSPNRNREHRTPAERIIHRAQFIADDGGVSALCFSSPRAINLRVASWTIRSEAVTCRRCIAMLPLLPRPEPREATEAHAAEYDA